MIGGQRERHTWHVPAGVWLAGTNELWWHTSRAVRPADAGGSDTRTLALRVTGVTVGRASKFKSRVQWSRGRPQDPSPRSAKPQAPRPYGIEKQFHFERSVALGGFWWCLASTSRRRARVGCTRRRRPPTRMPGNPWLPAGDDVAQRELARGSAASNTVPLFSAAVSLYSHPV